MEPSCVDTTEPLRRRAPGCVIPLAGSQRRLWKYATENQQYGIGTVAIARRALGRLDSGLLEESAAAVVERHESLRTRIVASEAGPTQRIDPTGSFRLEEMDLSGLPRASAATEARRIVEEYAEHSVDPVNGPLFKMALLRLDREEHVLIFAADHIVSDAVSANIVSHEIWAMYRCRANAVEASLPALPVQFPDYAVWQERTYASWLAAHGEYWRTHLAGAPAVRLPVDSPGSESALRTVTSVTTPFGMKLSAALRELALRQRIRLPLVVLSVHALTMSRWCRQSDLSISFASHGRHTHPELKSMVGLLASFPPLRVAMNGHERGVDLLERVRCEFDLAFAHFDFDRAIELGHGCGDSEVGFNWIAPDALRNPGERVNAGMNALRLQPFPLRLSWLGKLFVFYSDTPAGVAASITYRPDLFTYSNVVRLGQQLRSTAQALVEHPHAALDCVREIRPCAT